MHSLPYFRFASHVYDLPTGASHAKAFLVFWRDCFQGSYCQCHYCKCEKGHVHCKGHGHKGGGYGEWIWNTMWRQLSKVHNHSFETLSSKYRDASMNTTPWTSEHAMMFICQWISSNILKINTVRHPREEILLRGGGGRVLPLWLLQV